MIINAKNCILGRLATTVAKRALLGDEVIIFNCEDAIITGNKKTTLNKYFERLERGSTESGPFQPKRPDKFVRRTIRGMLPYKGFKGKPAFARIKTFIGEPEEYASKVTKDFKCKTVNELDRYKFITVGRICKELGGKGSWLEK